MSGKIRILVAGKSGQLARSLKALERSAPDLDLRFFGRPELDITDPEACRSLVDRVQPDLVMNLAAFTNVDAAESHPDAAHAVNGAGAGYLAHAAANRGTPIIHVSTDYVFDGAKASAYSEADQTGPVNIYGASKLAGERQVRQGNPKHIILRTAWLYSPFGKNFVSWLLAAAAGGSPPAIVTDQIGNPTSTLDLAGTLFSLCRRLKEGDWSRLPGVYHLASPEPMTRHDWAQRVLDVSAQMSGPAGSVRTAATDDFPTPAVRPLRTVLDITRYRTTFGLDFPSHETSFGVVLRALLKTREATI